MHVSGTPAVLIGRDVSNEPLRSIRNIDIGAYRTLELIALIEFSFSFGRFYLFVVF